MQGNNIFDNQWLARNEDPLEDVKNVPYFGQLAQVPSDNPFSISDEESAVGPEDEEAPLVPVYPTILPWNEVAKRSIKNLVPSGLNLFKEGAMMMRPVGRTQLSPLRLPGDWTLFPGIQEIARLIGYEAPVGLAAQVVGGEIDTPMIDGLLEFYKENYGIGPENIGGFRRFLSEDPVGFLSDLMMFASFGAGAAAAVPRVVKGVRAGTKAAKAAAGAAGTLGAGELLTGWRTGRAAMRFEQYSAPLQRLNRVINHGFALPTTAAKFVDSVPIMRKFVKDQRVLYGKRRGQLGRGYDIGLAEVADPSVYGARAVVWGLRKLAPPKLRERIAPRRRTRIRQDAITRIARDKFGFTGPIPDAMRQALGAFLDSAEGREVYRKEEIGRFMEQAGVQRPLTDELYNEILPEVDKYLKDKKTESIGSIAQRLGIELPLSAEMESQLQAAIEAVAYKQDIGAVRDIVEQVESRLEDIAASTVERMSEVADLAEAGELGAKGYWEFVDTWRQSMDTLYGEIAGLDNIPIVLAHTWEFYQRFMEQSKLSEAFTGKVEYSSLLHNIGELIADRVEREPDLLQMGEGEAGSPQGPGSAPQPPPPPPLPGTEGTPGGGARVQGRGRLIVGNYSGNKYVAENTVVDVSELIPSHFEDGTANPVFPEALQPRDRTDLSSELQILDLARNLDPELLLHETSNMNQGSPIVLAVDKTELRRLLAAEGVDNLDTLLEQVQGDTAYLVLSGNGRTAAMQLAAREPDLQPRMLRLRDELLETYAMHGLTADMVQGKNFPVLVRKLASELSDEQLRAFVKEANESGGKAHRAAEVGAQEADLMTNDILTLFEVGEEGNLRAALKSGKNTDFVNAFIQQFPDDKQPQFYDASGRQISDEGFAKIERAMLTTIFSGQFGSVMAARFSDVSEPGLTNLKRGIYGAMGALGHLKALIDNNVQSADYDIAEDLARAVIKMAELQDSAESAANALAQTEMSLGEAYTGMPDNVARILQLVERGVSAPKDLTDFIKWYVDQVRLMPGTHTETMFDLPNPTKTEILQAALGDKFGLPDIEELRRQLRENQAENQEAAKEVIDEVNEMARELEERPTKGAPVPGEQMVERVSSALMEEVRRSNRIVSAEWEGFIRADQVLEFQDEVQALGLEWDIDASLEITGIGDYEGVEVRISELSFAEMEQKMGQFFELLDRYDVDVTLEDAPGFHVHVDKAGLTDAQIRNIVFSWLKYEWAIENEPGWQNDYSGKFVSQMLMDSETQAIIHGYLEHMDELKGKDPKLVEEEILSERVRTDTQEGGPEPDWGGRASFVPETWHGTFEFRQGEGTDDFQQAMRNVTFALGFIERFKDRELAPGMRMSLDDVSGELGVDLTQRPRAVSPELSLQNHFRAVSKTSDLYFVYDDGTGPLSQGIMGLVEGYGNHRDLQVFMEQNIPQGARLYVVREDVRKIRPQGDDLQTSIIPKEIVSEFDAREVFAGAGEGLVSPVSPRASGPTTLTNLFGGANEGSSARWRLDTNLMRLPFAGGLISGRQDLGVPFPDANSMAARVWAADLNEDTYYRYLRSDQTDESLRDQHTTAVDLLSHHDGNRLAMAAAHGEDSWEYFAYKHNKFRAGGRPEMIWEEDGPEGPGLYMEGAPAHESLKDVLQMLAENPDLKGGRIVTFTAKGLGRLPTRMGPGVRVSIDEFTPMGDFVPFQTEKLMDLSDVPAEALVAAQRQQGAVQVYRHLQGGDLHGGRPTKGAPTPKGKAEGMIDIDTHPIYGDIASMIDNLMRAPGNAYTDLLMELDEFRDYYENKLEMQKAYLQMVENAGATEAIRIAGENLAHYEELVDFFDKPNWRDILLDYMQNKYGEPPITPEEVESRVELLRVNFDKNKPFSIKGFEFKSERELATIMQAARKVGREDLHLFYLIQDANGQFTVVGHETTHLNSPVQTSERFPRDILAQVTKLQNEWNTRVYFMDLHNHPGAPAQFSQGDLRAYDYAEQYFRGTYLGSLVIDSGEYGSHVLNPATGVYETTENIRLSEAELGWDPEWHKAPPWSDPYPHAARAVPERFGLQPHTSGSPDWAPRLNDPQFPMGKPGSESERLAEAFADTGGEQATPFMNKGFLDDLRKHLVNFGKQLQLDFNWTVFAVSNSQGRLNAIVQMKDLHRLESSVRARYVRDRLQPFGGITYVYVGKGDWYRKTDDAVQMFEEIANEVGGIVSIRVSGRSRVWLSKEPGFHGPFWKSEDLAMVQHDFDPEGVGLEYHPITERRLPQARTPITPPRAAPAPRGGRRGRGLEATREGSLPPVYFKNLKALRTLIGQHVFSRGTPAKGDVVKTQEEAFFVGLYNALTKDLSASVGKHAPEKVGEFEEVSRQYREGVKKINEGWGRRIAKMSVDGDHEGLVKAIFKPTTEIGQIPLIYELIGGKDSEGGKAMQAAFVSDLFERAHQAGGGWSTGGLRRQLDRYGDRRLEAFLDAETVQSLNDVADIALSMQDFARMSSGSQTAFLLSAMEQSGTFGGALRQLAYMSAAGPHGFIMLIAAWLGQEAMVEFMTSKAGRDFIRKGGWGRWLGRGAEKISQGMSGHLGRRVIRSQRVREDEDEAAAG